MEDIQKQQQKNNYSGFNKGSPPKKWLFFNVNIHDVYTLSWNKKQAKFGLLFTLSPLVATTYFRVHHTIIGLELFHFCVRNGNRWDKLSIILTKMLNLVRGQIGLRVFHFCVRNGNRLARPPILSMNSVIQMITGEAASLFTIVLPKTSMKLVGGWRTTLVPACRQAGNRHHRTQSLPADEAGVALVCGLRHAARI